MPVATIQKSFCTTRQAAALLGVSVGTVQLWVESGLLQAWKTSGGHRRVLRASVDCLLHNVSQPALPSSATASQPVCQPAKPRRLSILVVEDDPGLLRLYDIQMSRWPMAPEVIGINNAFAALLMMGRAAPDLLIIDLHMPKMDGFGLLSVLHQAPEMANTTIVVVSGLDSQSIADRGDVPAGIEVLAKPIPFDRLLAIATGIVKQSGFTPPALPVHQ